MKRGAAYLVRSTLLTAALIVASTLTVSAQSPRVNGVVTGADGVPLAGATVRVEGTTLGVITDRAGAFKLVVDEGDRRLVTTYVGYTPDTTLLKLTEPKEYEVRIQLRPRTDGSTVTVTTQGDPSSAASARRSEKDAAGVTSVLSAEEMERHADQSTAESMQRAPGVAITRVRGEARETVVRGMEPRYNSTQIDGVKMPSPSLTGRTLQLDFIPNDLLERVEVMKSLTPDMEGDAIGGTVNLVMRSAPRARFARARLGIGYSTPWLTNTMRRFSTDSILEDPLVRLGTDRPAGPTDFPRSTMKTTEGNAPPNINGELTYGGRWLDEQLGAIVGVSLLQGYQRSEVVHNYDAVNVDNEAYLIRRQLRYHSHDRTKIGANAKVDYVLDSSNQVYFSAAGAWRINREVRLLDDSNYVYQPVLYHSTRTVEQNYTLFSGILSGAHKVADVDVQWQGGWAEARQTRPGRAELSTAQELRNDVAVTAPVFYSAVQDWQRHRDRDLFARLDLSFRITPEIIAKAGGLFRDKTRFNAQNEYRLNPVLDASGVLPPFITIDQVEWEVLNTAGTPLYGRNNYTCSEDLSAAYAMATWKLGDLSILAGVRVERTDARYETFDVNSVAQIAAEKIYTDVLPSINARYALTPTSNLRFAIGRSLARPNYYDLVPYVAIVGDEREAGNPYLNRTRSTNLDMRYELYPGGGQQFSVGAFYKNIVDPIERAIDLSTPSLPTLQPRNYGTATLVGAELVGSIALGGGFLLEGNYTFTHSSITSPKLLFDNAGESTLSISETRPMQGQADHIGNLSLSWKDTAVGLSAQVGLTYTGKRLYQVSIYYQHNDWLQPFTLLDLTLEQKLSNALSLSFQCTNLLNDAWEIREESGQLIESERYGLSALLGLSYRF